MNAVVGDNKFLQASDIKITDNQISTDDTSIIWDITLNENGTYTISNNGQFVGYSGSSTTTKLYNSSDEGQSTWNISKNSDNTVKISNSTTSDRLLRYNTSVPRFASYATTGSEKDPTLYRLIDGKSDVTVTFTEVSGDKSLFFEEGLTYNSAATADPERPITYSSSNQEVATIDATGMVTLVGPGTTVIKATTEADDTYHLSRRCSTIYPDRKSIVGYAALFDRFQIGSGRLDFHYDNRYGTMEFVTIWSSNQCSRERCNRSLSHLTQDRRWKYLVDFCQPERVLGQ